MLAALPLLALVVAAYNVIVFTGASSIGVQLTSYALISGDVVVISIADGLIAVGVLLLYLEILKATRTGAASLIDHLFSMLVFVVALVQFLALPGFGTPTFLIITLMCFVDVVAGFTVTISTARRDIDIR